MPTKAKPNGLIVHRDVLRKFAELDNVVTDIQRERDVTKQRVEILEKHARDMQPIPAQVSGLNSTVESLKSSMVREMDGLREQQKAHKDEMGKKVDDGFEAVGTSISELSIKVGGMWDKDKQADSIKRFLLRAAACMGGLLAGAAALAEIIRAIKGAA